MSLSAGTKRRVIKEFVWKCRGHVDFVGCPTQAGVMRRSLHLSFGLAALLIAGCPVATSNSQPSTSNVSSVTRIDEVMSSSHADEPTQESSRGSVLPLTELVSQTLEQNRRHRQLSSSTHGAWQILHGILAYGPAFELQTPSGPQPALDYLLAGQAIKGFEPEQGEAFGSPQRRGLRMAMQPSTKTGQGHRDQWLAVIAQAGLPLETEIQGKDHTFTLDDWIRQAEFDVPRNLEREFSWSLIALTAYRDTNHRWKARDGFQYSTESLLDSELGQSLPNSVCGGTHRLIGMAMALNKRRQEERPITGIWAEVDAQISAAIQLAQQNQNPDGSYSVAYLHRPGWTRDLGETLGSTGHVLEFLALAAPTATLTEPWVERSVRRLCQVLEECSEVDLECGVLYHALHGLSEYQKRLQPAS